MRIILRPLRKNAWSGLIKYRNCYEDLKPYWTRSGRIYTGLTRKDEQRLSEILDLDLKQDSEFWKNFFVRTSGRDLYLDIEDAMDELRYLFLKSHKRVKNSIMEHKASANFVLINKDEEAKRDNIYGRVKREALKEFGLLSPDDMRKCLRLYGHNADSLSNEILESRLFKIVEGNPESFINKWVKNVTRDTEFLIESCISRNIIRKNKNIYKYGTEIIGHGLSDVISFLEDPKNQDIKITILRQIEPKDRLKAELPEADKKSFDDEEVKEGKESKIKGTKKGDTI